MPYQRTGKLPTVIITGSIREGSVCHQVNKVIIAIVVISQSFNTGIPGNRCLTQNVRKNYKEELSMKLGIKKLHACLFTREKLLESGGNIAIFKLCVFDF